MYIWRSLSQKGVQMVSDPPLQYLKGRRRKNKVIQVRSAIIFCLGIPPCAVVLRK